MRVGDCETLHIIYIYIYIYMCVCVGEGGCSSPPQPICIKKPKDMKSTSLSWLSLSKRPSLLRHRVKKKRAKG
jgi:hypothetical protein